MGAISIVVVLMCLICIFNIFKKKKNLEQIENNRDRIECIINNFYSETKGDKYISHRDYLQIKDRYKNDYDFIKSLDVPDNHELHHETSYFLSDYVDLDWRVEGNNKEFVSNEKRKYKELLSNIDGKSLDEQQRDVVVSDEDHTLVVAGAGSGKTLTISGKVKYLCEAKNVKPEDILLISFTKKSAQEMTDRITNKLGYSVQATTFHKLGLDILKEAKGKTYEVLDDVREFIEEYFDKHIGEDKNLLRNLIEFFAYYLQIPANVDKLDSLGEAYEMEKSSDLETIKSKYNINTFVEKEKGQRVLDKRTLKNEKVKSLQEIEIANFLFLHGVEYEYEALYPYQEEDNTRRAYHPDFYLKDYDIYIEHFGINEDNKCPQLSKIEEEKYIDDMNWKRECHKKNKTRLLETYSYYQTQGILLDKLEELLKNSGVVFKEIDLEDVFNAVYPKKNKYFSEFITLCSTFISLFKSNGYTFPDDLATLTYKDCHLNNNNYYCRRMSIFKEIVSILLNEYNQHLKNENAYDFSDMINLSAELINNGYKIKDYKYVIIDEFQDISIARYKLVKAILEQTKAKLLCVGDDWQSIYRFAGSDISLFTNFEKYFGYSKIMKIEKTYRNSQELIDEAGLFVMKNPKQLQKHLTSDKSIKTPIVLKHYVDDPRPVLKQVIDEIISSSGKNTSIMLLGRTSYDFDIVKKSELFFGNRIDDLHYKNSPDTKICFLTVHKSKGLEAENVILLNFENSSLGFPNKIADDPLIELVLSESDDYLYAEERRLFYVAVTRTKNRTYILENTKCPSEFKNDLNFLKNAKTNDSEEKLDILCPKCKTGHLVKRKRAYDNSCFIGCSNYPKCDYTNNDVAAVENKKVCPNCGGFLTLKPGKWGAFYGCTNYPKCNYTEKYEDINYCPKCGSELRLRKSKNGIFWGCSNYPKCDYTKNINN